MSLPFPAGAAEFLRGRTVFCGFSGGSDSLYLLLALNENSAPFHFQLRAVHFNHGLRGAESDADEAWCREKCRAESIPFLSVALDVDGRRKPGEGDEAAARRLRLLEWQRLIREAPGSVVALGHQADDRTENLLMRLFRGSNVSGLTSMRFRSVVENVEFVRPLLLFDRAELENYLRLRGEVWRTDSTNNSDCYGRNFLRRNLIPSIDQRFPFAIGGMRRSIAVLAQDADYLEREAQKIYAAGTVTGPADWAALHPAIRCRVLRSFLETRCAGFVPDAALLSRFSDAVQHPPANGESAMLPVPGLEPYVLCIDRDSVSLQSNAEFPPVHWMLEHQAECRFAAYRLCAELVPASEYRQPDLLTAYFSPEMPSELVLSARRDGDRMVPFGKRHPVSLKKLYSDARIKRYERNSLPVLRTGDDAILWIPGVRRSAFWPVSDGSGMIWRIRAEKIFPE